jgi:hypothetical protein
MGFKGSPTSYLLPITYYLSYNLQPITNDSQDLVDPIFLLQWRRLRGKLPFRTTNKKEKHGARVAELVDALDLGSSASGRGSSNLPSRTIMKVHPRCSCVACLHDSRILGIRESAPARKLFAFIQVSTPLFTPCSRRALSGEL